MEKKKRKERKPIDEGTVFGALTAIGQVGTVPYGKNGNTQPLIRCVCECGAITDVRKYSLTSGNTKSCGCLRVETTGCLTLSHGRSKETVYWVWKSMIKRCCNPNDPAYERYGGRGIYVSDEWKHSFEQFISDMGERPDGLSLERIDNDSGYCKENCKWATRLEQNSNRRAPSTNTSGRKGVYYHSKYRKWYAAMTRRGKTTQSPFYDTFDEAVKHREKFETEHAAMLLKEGENH